MSQIINPERRDPSFSRLKADVGLSKVNNVSLSEILVLAGDQIKEEVNRGDVYATQELSSSNRKPIYIPLCRFKDNSSWANIIIGLIDSSSNVLSFVETKVIHTKDKDTGLDLSISAAPENSLWGIIKFHLAENGNKDELYLSLPYNAYSKYKISGVTINVKDYLISTSGSSVSSNIEILSHSSIIDTLEYKQVIDLKSLNRRDISSSTESLAVYKNNELYFPGNSEDLSEESFDLPKINGVPFTGDRSLKYKEKSTRDITITAKHSGKDVGEAGIHDWKVLEGIPVVGYKNTGESEESKENSTNTTTSTTSTTTIPGTPQPLLLENEEESETKTESRTTTVTYTYGTDALGKGLCRLVDIPELPETSGSSIQNIANLRGLVNEVSSLNDEHVVSIGFLRKYTELLLRVVESGLSGSGVSGSKNNDFWFFKGNLTSDSTEEEINNSKKLGLSLLTASPIAGKYVRYQFCSLFDTSVINPTKIYLSLPKDSPYVLRKVGTQEDLNKTDEIIELGPSKVINEETSEVKNYSNVYTFDICSKEDVSINETSFGKPIDLYVLYGESTVGKIRISSDVFSSAKDSCVFKDGTNGEYKLPIVFTRAGYFNEDENSEKKFNEFRNYALESEFLTCTKENKSTTDGLIWKSFDSSKYEIGCNLPPRNDWFSKTRKSLLLEFFSISSNLMITNNTSGSITIYKNSSLEPEQSVTIGSGETGEVGKYTTYSEDLFEYKNILKNNYSFNSSSYKYYLKFNKDEKNYSNNSSIEESLELGSIVFSSSSEYAILNVYQRPDILRWEDNSSTLTRLFIPYTMMLTPPEEWKWSSEIPVSFKYNSKLPLPFVDKLNFISKLDTQEDGYLFLSDSKSGDLILSGSGKENLSQIKTVTYSLENQDVYWNSISKKYYPQEFIPEPDIKDSSASSSKISEYEYVGDTVIRELSFNDYLPTSSASATCSISSGSGSLRKIMVILSTGNTTPWTKYSLKFDFNVERLVPSNNDGDSIGIGTICEYFTPSGKIGKVEKTGKSFQLSWPTEKEVTLPSDSSHDDIPPGIFPYSRLVRTIKFTQEEFNQPQYYDTFGDNTITYEITFIFTTKYSVITDINTGLTNSKPGLIINNNTDLTL